MAREIKVAIDIRDLRISKTGAKTYLEEICKELSKGKPGFSFVFIDTWLSPYTGKNKMLKSIEHLQFFFWKQVSLPLICVFKKCDILFCTDYFVPWFKPRLKTVVVFHDAFFWEYPEQYNLLWLKILNSIGISAAKKANAIVTTTEYSKKQITKFTGLPEKSIFPVPLAPKSFTAPNPSLHINPKDTKKYILHVGVMEKRKNIPKLIAAFHLLLQEGYEDYTLVLVGSPVQKEKINDFRNICNLIQELKLEQKVIMPGFVSNEELAFYYESAAVYAFVSVNEGFGIPVLEAFQYKIPTLIADNSCLPEIGGDAVISCNPYDENDIKEKLKLILNNKELQKNLVEKGTKRLSLFSWSITAEKLLNVFREICSK